MSMASSSSIIAHNFTVFSAKPSTRFQAMAWDPISRLAVTKRKNDELSFWGNKKTLQYTRKTFVVSANTEPGVPPASGPPPSSNKQSWVLGLVVSFILPFFTNKLGPLAVIKNKLENTVQTVEEVVEAVEKVALTVDKIAEEIGDDVPEGKLRDLIEKVENLAEKTAKTADSLDDVIDKVQEAGDQVDDVICAAKEEKKSSTEQKKIN